MSEARRSAVSVRIYRRCLRLYPEAFRRAYGDHMEATFRDALRGARERAGAVGVGWLWVRTISDLLYSVAREHGDVRRSERGAIASAENWSHAGRAGKGRKGMFNVKDDIRWAFRSLVRQPAFAGVAIVTLALGIGANTALFSVVRTALLTPLPYANPSSVAMIWSRWKNFDKTWVSEPEYHNYRATLHAFEDIGLFRTFESSITEGEEPERVAVASVMPNVFPILGVSPVIGRGFREEEAQPNGPDVVVLGEDLWQRRYGGDPSVVGRSISVNGQPYEVLGVMPAGFRTPLDYRTDRPTDLWFPYALFTQPGPVPFAGGSHGSYAIGRLRPGVTADAANTELRSVVAKLQAEATYPQDWHFQAFAVPVQDEVTGSLRSALMVLLGAVGLVLLIACVNVANLLLVRAEDRRTEIGVRSAVGASGARLARQLIAENAVLAGAGGLVGIGFAWAGVAVVRAYAPAGLPRVGEASIDAGVLGFTALISLATAAIFGLLPALQTARTETRAILAEGGRANSAGSARTRVRRALIAAEVALAVVLAIGAGLMLRSFSKLLAIDPGFDAENALAMRLSTPSAYYPDDAAVTSFYTRMLDRVRSVPGVRSAGLIRLLPIDQEMGDSCVTVEGYAPPPGECAAADWQAATDGYFEAIGQKVLEGRGIEAGDVADAPQVIVVNQEFVRRFFADGNALGKRVRFLFLQDGPDQAVVGVVEDTRHNGMTGTIKPAFYRPHAQWAASTGNPQRTVSLVVRTDGDPLARVNAIRAAIHEIDARLPVSSIQTMEDVLARATAQPRFTLILLLSFGGLALVLAVIGIYGVVSFAVASRSHELGIRMALGAGPGSVVWLSLKHGLAWAVVGIVAGSVAALGATRLMNNIVYDVTTWDPATYGIVIAIALLVSLGASWVPARRASRADPLSALRSGSS